MFLRIASFVRTNKIKKGKKHHWVQIKEINGTNSIKKIHHFTAYTNSESIYINFLWGECNRGTHIVEDVRVYFLACSNLPLQL